MSAVCCLLCADCCATVTAAAAAAAAAAEALNAGGSDSRTARGSKSIFDTFGVTLPKGSGPRD